MTDYWVYHNWRRKRALIHHRTCPECQNGEGKIENKTAENSKWLPFGNLEAAQRFIDQKASEKYEQTGTCNTCGGKPYVRSESAEKTKKKSKYRRYVVPG